MSSWVNWAGDQSCVPAEIATPTSVDDVVGIVRRAAESGRRIRVAGAGHSFTDAVLTDGILVSLDQLDRLLDVDADTGLVRVQAGISLRRLSELMHVHGLAFPNLGDIDVQSIAGATATATHGTGARLQNLSAALHSVEIVTGNGELVELRADADPQAWRAARVSIGALGIVTAVTIAAVPSFVLHADESRMPVAAVLDDLDTHLADNEHFEFFLFPHARDALVKRNNRTTATERPSRAARATSYLTQNIGLDAVARVGRARPTLIPRLNRTVTALLNNEVRIDRSYRVFASPRKIKFTEMEYALPREHGVEALRRIIEVSERFDTPLPIEARWVAADDAYLSPAHGRDTCYIAVHMYRGMPWEPYFRAAESIFDDYGGRPHWGKRHTQTAATLAARYPEWDRFAAVRDRLDPARLFTNAYVERVLG